MNATIPVSAVKVLSSREARIQISGGITTATQGRYERVGRTTYRLTLQSLVAELKEHEGPMVEREQCLYCERGYKSRGPGRWTITFHLGEIEDEIVSDSDYDAGCKGWLAMKDATPPQMWEDAQVWLALETGEQR